MRQFGFWNILEQKLCLKNLWDPVITMPVAWSALHDLVFTTYRPAKEEVGWSAMGCNHCRALETFVLFLPLILLLNIVHFAFLFCQHSRPIDGRCDWWGVALTDSPKACIVFVVLIPKNSRLKRQPKCFFFHFYYPVTQTSQYTYYTNILHLCIGSCEIRDNILIKIAAERALWWKTAALRSASGSYCCLCCGHKWYKCTLVNCF